MPALDALAKREGDRFKIIVVSQDLEGQAKVAPFFAEKKFVTLEPYLDTKNVLMTALETDTLPTTVFYDAKGKEQWRVTGAMDWSGDRAKKADRRLPEPTGRDQGVARDRASHQPDHARRRRSAPRHRLLRGARLATPDARGRGCRLLSARRHGPVALPGRRSCRGCRCGSTHGQRLSRDEPRPQYAHPGGRRRGPRDDARGRGHMCSRWPRRKSGAAMAATSPIRTAMRGRLRGTPVFRSTTRAESRSRTRSRDQAIMPHAPEPRSKPHRRLSPPGKRPQSAAAAR